MKRTPAAGRQSPPPRDREETSGIPPEREEPRRRRDDEAAASPHQWFEKITGEVRAARRDLQTAFAHPQLRPAVLLALRAFAQAAQVGATTSLPADTIEQGSPREIALAEHLTHYGQWVEKITGEVRAARRDLQTAFAHPQLRPAVLLALRAFAQAAQAGATTPPPADAVTFPFVELGPNLLVPLDARAPRQGDLPIGESPRMREVTRLLEQVSETTAAVLITGEPGTGKDVIARLLHEQGPRAQGPFITVNCAAIPETRLEAELFGEERGMVTGATQRTPGRLELAAGGTLFLDEIEALSPELQAKLLRVLQDRRFERVGGTETLTTDARIVAATNQDLEGLIAEGRFRRDLFYRLNVYPIALPPLRERPEDLPRADPPRLPAAGPEGSSCRAGEGNREARAPPVARQCPGAGGGH